MSVHKDVFYTKFKDQKTTATGEYIMHLTIQRYRKHEYMLQFKMIFVFKNSNLMGHRKSFKSCMNFFYIIYKVRRQYECCSKCCVTTRAVKHIEPVFEQKEDKKWTEEVSGYVKVYTKGSEHRVIHVKIIIKKNIYFYVILTFRMFGFYFVEYLEHGCSYCPYIYLIFEYVRTY